MLKEFTTANSKIRLLLFEYHFYKILSFVQEVFMEPLRY